MAYPSPDIRNINRDQRRLQLEKDIRTKYPELRVLDADWKRIKLLWLVWAEMRPSFGAWLKEQLYENPNLFQDMNLPPHSTIDKDNRELEREGFFSKPEAVKETAALMAYSESQ